MANLVGAQKELLRKLLMAEAERRQAEEKAQARQRADEASALQEYNRIVEAAKTRFSAATQEYREIMAKLKSVL